MGRPLRRSSLRSGEKQTPWTRGTPSLHWAPTRSPARASLPRAARRAAARIACSKRQSPSPPPPDTYAGRRVQREEGSLVKLAGIELGKASRGKTGANEGTEEEKIFLKNKKKKKIKKKKINKRTEKHTLVKLGALCKSAVSKQQITEAQMQCRGRAYVTREAGLASRKNRRLCLSLAFSTHHRATWTAMRETPKKQRAPSTRWSLSLNHPGKRHHPLPLCAKVTSVFSAPKREGIGLFLLDQTYSSRCSNPNC